MSSRRGLFLTNIVSKFTEKMIKNRWKKTTEKGLTPYQCGGVRGICDNLLIVNSTIEEFRAKRENLYVLFADLEKCFDQLWLKDCIKEIAEAGMPAAEAFYLYKMNEQVKATVETPIGKTGTFHLKEIVKQGTVSAVDLCGVSTDKINKVKQREPPLIVSGVEIKHPVYVDDTIALGSKEMIEALEPKMKFLEETKKYIYNNEKGKTEIMKLQLKKKSNTDDENPIVNVNKGKIEYTKEYKCLGDMYDTTGRNTSKIEKKMEKVGFISAEVKRRGSYKMVGCADGSVRMLMLEALVKPTLLANTETWVNLTCAETEKINQGHYQVLRKVFEQKEGTPYYAILCETGYWPYSYQIIYKRLMYFHQLIHSNEERVARKMVINQKNGMGTGRTWYDGVEKWLVELEITKDIETIQKISKIRWKRDIKRKMERLLEQEMEEQLGKMTKLRFIEKFGKKDYVQNLPMAKVKDIMKMRLNMCELKSNFKRKYVDELCPACELEKETTEHVILCGEYKRMTRHNLQINKPIKQLMNDSQWVIEASEVYGQIEELRKWFIT